MYKKLSSVSKSLLTFRMTGSTSLNFAYVSAGRYDIFMKNTIHHEDIIPGILFIQEAGGLATQLDGKTVDKDIKSIVAANSVLCKRFLSRMKTKHL